ncbi:MAG: right-handed parallel beta-helix repeat-containing protein [Pseudomonadota bacterium]|nr:right-handed parallel beta-helix repeat-containing protein [Pseudomonadota bacterium]
MRRWAPVAPAPVAPAPLALAPLALALALAACDGGGKPDGPVEDPPSIAAPGPCADGTWMGAASPDGLVFVATGTEPGDGSRAAPYSRLLDAVNAVADPGGTVAVYPGTYEAGIVLRSSGGRPVAIVGCGAEETFLASNTRHAGVALHGPGELALRRVAVVGGTPAVAVRAGAAGTVEDVVVSSARRVGVQVAGPTTVATLRRLTVADTVLAGAQRGWGISLADGALTLEDSVIAAQRAYGLYAERGVLQVAGLDIAGGVDGPTVGGIYAHAMESVTLDDVTVRGVRGVGIHLYEVGTATVRGSVVEDTAAGQRRGAGDAILVRKGARDTATVRIEGNTVTRPARFGIAVDGGDVTLTGNTVTGGLTSDGTSVWATPGTTITGDPASPLDVGRFPIGRDEHPGEGPSEFGRPGMP